VPKNKGKLLMNMLIIAAGAVPRGGLVTVSVSGDAGSESFEIIATSDPEKRQKTLIPSGVKALLAGNPEEGVDARGIQPFYAGLLARLSDMELDLSLEEGVFRFAASPK
jgi:histidine phosphotransferase ChpT